MRGKTHAPGHSSAPVACEGVQTPASRKASRRARGARTDQPPQARPRRSHGASATVRASAPAEAGRSRRKSLNESARPGVKRISEEEKA